jgi:DNA-binding NarL/FixJ family response regulator
VRNEFVNARDPTKASVVLVEVPPSAEARPGYQAIRRVGLNEVAASVDVAVLRGPGAGSQVRHLATRLGAAMPRVLVIVPRIDLDDARLALIHGATSYVIESPEASEVEAGLPDVIVMTAAGMGCLDPPIATALARWLRRMDHGPASRGAGRVTRPASEEAALTPRETQIMRLLATGHTVSETAVKLGISTGTVRNNLTRIYAKLKVRRQPEAILAFLRQGRA